MFNLGELYTHVRNYKNIVQQLISDCGYTGKWPSDAILTRNNECYLKITENYGVIDREVKILKKIRAFFDPNVKERHEEKHKAWIGFMQDLTKYFNDIYKNCDKIIQNIEDVDLQDKIQELKQFISEEKKKILIRYLTKIIPRTQSVPAPLARKTTGTPRRRTAPPQGRRTTHHNMPPSIRDPHIISREAFVEGFKKGPVSHLSRSSSVATVKLPENENAFASWPVYPVKPTFPQKAPAPRSGRERERVLRV